MKKKSRIATLLLLAGCFGLPSTIGATNNAVSINLEAQQQVSTVKGLVVDAQGPLGGATVMVKGTSNGTITDFNGEFILKGVVKGATLEISFMGYVTRDIVYRGQKNLRITLKEDTQKMDEVVVTALGMKRKTKALGYSATEVDGDVIAKAGTISPVTALQGKIAGVQIEQSDGGMFGNTKIEIRGASTLSGNNQPIFVVDGIILDNAISDTSADWSGNPDDWGNELKSLNPDDFESITVLKGAAATAMYGSRGLNGAVVITTKSGKRNAGVGVRVTQTFGVDHVFSTPDLQNQYGEGWWTGRADYGDGTSRWNNQKLIKNSSGEYSKIDGATGLGWGMRFDGREIEDYDHTTGHYRAYPNNYKDMFQLGLNSNTNVSVSGGNDKTTFYTSISYRTARGTVVNNKFERLSLMAKASHQITDRIRLAASLSFVNSLPKNPQVNIGEYFTSGAIPRELDMNYYKDKYKGPHGGIAQGDDKYAKVPDAVKSFWWNVNENSYERKETSIRPTVDLSIKLFDWLRWDCQFNYNYYYTRFENKTLGSGYAMEGGEYGLGNSTKEQVNVSTNLYFNKKISADFETHGFIRGEYFNQETQWSDAKTKGGLIVPGKFFLDNSKQTSERTAGINATKRITSFVFQLGASYKDQLFLDVTGRNDWSSSLVYADGTGNYSYFYPSVSGSWLLTETFKLPKFISFAKLRASWAQVGNDTSPYFINSGYGIHNTLFGSKNVYSLSMPDDVKSRDLKPERKTSIEFGLDWRFLNNRIAIDATYYKENTRNQIINIEVPPISGIKHQTVNAGDIENSGIELALKTVPIQTKDWRWTVDMTYTKNKNRINALHKNVANYINLSGNLSYGNYRIASVAKVGADYGLLVSDSRPAVNKNGDPILIWSNTDRTAIAKRSNVEEEVGSLVPDFLGSLATSLTYKNFTLRAALDMRFGGMVASYCNRYGTAYGYTGKSADYRHGKGLAWISNYSDTKGRMFTDGIIPDGVFADGVKVTTVSGQKIDVSGQRYSDLVKAGKLEPSHLESWAYWRNSWGNGVLNDDWFEELSYIALREISLYYTFPKSIANKMGATNLSLGLSARNLGYLYNSLTNNLNPESVRGTSSTEFRIRGYNPYTANYMFTISASF